MRTVVGIVLLAATVACTVAEPEPEVGIPIEIINGDDESASVEVTLYNAVTGMEQTTLEPMDLEPGERTTIRLEPTRGRDDAFHLKINGYVAMSSDFAGCTPDNIEPPLPRALEITVLPNGEPGACPWVER